MKELVNRYRQYLNEQKEMATSKINVVKLRQLGEGIEATKDLIKAEAVQVKVAKKNMEVAQNRLAEAVKERKIQETMLDIKRRFGKNAILRGTNFEEGATAKERNQQIGGHRAGEALNEKGEMKK